ncbi:MAG: DUF3465 domain-containing protein [Candidatus Aminicenantes bacterium]|nr:DUF3465 domain-containing protein [Candidatus Aminicenantes bacterium]MCK5005061.1 DUF3465 domain-containing protein [Candidatus Aminicenantes bacterium]
MRIIKNILLIIVIGVLVYFYVQNGNNVHDPHSERVSVDNQSILDAIHKRLKDVQVNGSGKVSRVLSDDNYGDRHQRFVLRLPHGHTVLIAHNIDLAPRIGNLKQGDVVEFYGEYEWNSKGGVVHWTHHDPNGHHKDGWLKHNSRVYK